MPVFHARTSIPAPVRALASFHQEPGALKRLTPPPIFAQMHAIEPLAENSLAEFTLWFGPFPVRWLAKHSQVDLESGFTDTQVSGPLRSWVHEHRWRALDAHTSLLEDRVTYEHLPGWRGMLTRLLFAPILLKIMFAYRHAVTRLALRHKA